MKTNEVRAWGERLEAGETDDPTLRLAGALKSWRAPVARPSPAFVRELRRNLVTAPRILQRSVPGWLVPAMAAAALVALAALLLRPGETASAGQVFQHANRHYAALARQDGILRTEFSLSYTILDHVTLAPTDRYDWVGDLWQDMAGTDFRYELRDRQGGFHYFAQRLEGRFWRSVYPVTASRGDLVYALTEEQYAASDEIFRGGIAPVFGNLIDWLSLDSWWLAHAADCGNPFCVLGLVDNDLWKCDGRTCVLPLSTAIGDVPAAEVKLSWTGRERRADGRTVDVVLIRYTIGDELVRRLQFDSNTHELVEVVAYQMGSEVARMTFGRRVILDPGGEEVFGTLPKGLRQVIWPSPEPPPAPRLGDAPFPSAPRGSVPAVWPRPVLAIPSKGGELEGDTELVVFVSVPADLQMEVELIADLCDAAAEGDTPRVDPSSCSGLASATVGVPKGGGTQRLTLHVQPDESWPDRVWLSLRLRYPDGQSARLLDPAFSWRVEH